MNKLLKLDPGNTELLAQKHKLLGEAVAETKDRLETLKTAAEQANAALANGDISQAQYDALQREIIETEADLKKLEVQASQSATAIQKIAATGEKLKTLGDGISSAGKKFLPVTGAVTALGTAAVTTAANFDTGMSKVAAVSGATGSDLDALRDKAREMGSKTKFSASEAAEAMNYMAMAGWKTNDMLSGIEGVMNLAAASGEDLATTSDIVTDALTAFGMTAQDSGHFSDILAAASSNANTNVSMMGETFKYCAPIAGALGFSAEDTAEAIGLMANAGIKSTQAGTSLRSIMNNLTGDVKFCGSSIGEVTVATTNADGSMRSLSDILADCRIAFGGLTESEQASAAESLVGKNAMSGFLALMNAAPADIAKLSGAIDTCNGKSAEMASIMLDNLAGQLTILKSQLEELAISFGELLMPAISQIVTWVQSFVDQLNGMDEGTKKVIITVALFAAAIAPVLIIVGKVITAIGTIMTIVPKVAGVINLVKGAFAALNAVLLANPIGLIITAITALVAAFLYLWNNCEGFQQFWIDLWDRVKEAAIAAWNAIAAFFQATWSAISNTAQAIWNGLQAFFATLWDGIGTVFTTALEAITNAVSSAWEAVSDTTHSVLTSIKDNCETVWEAIKNAVITAMEAIKSAVTAAWNAVKETVIAVMEALKGSILAAWNAIQSAVLTVMGAIKDAITAAWETIRTVVTTVVTAIKDTVTRIWEAIKESVSNIMARLKDSIVNAWDSLKKAVTAAVGAIKDTVENVFSNLASGVTTAMGKVLDAVKSGFAMVQEHIVGLAKEAVGWGADVIHGIADGIRGAVSCVGNAVSSVADTIRSFLHFSVPDEGPLTDYASWMPDFMSGLAKGIEKSRGLVKSAIGNVADDFALNPTLSVTTHGMDSILNGDRTKTEDSTSSADSTICAKLDSMTNLLGKYLPRMSNAQVVLDSGVLVGELADGMNRQLGKVYGR